MEGVNTRIEVEEVYIRKEGVEKIISETFRLMFIKLEPSIKSFSAESRSSILI